MAGDVGGVREPRLRIALAIDQLEHSEDLGLAVFHRQSDQRARAVSALLIKRRIETVRPGLRNAISVWQLDDLAVERAVSGHRLFGDRQSVVAVGKLDAIVLCQFEPKLRETLSRLG